MWVGQGPQPLTQFCVVAGQLGASHLEPCNLGRQGFKQGDISFAHRDLLASCDEY